MSNHPIISSRVFKQRDLFTAVILENYLERERCVFATAAEAKNWADKRCRERQLGGQPGNA